MKNPRTMEEKSMAEIKWAESAHHLPIEDFSPNPRNPKKHTDAS